MLVPSKIILHCSATRDSISRSWDAIRRYHIDTNGWNDIGYHYGVEIVGDGIEWLRGRPYWKVGAHCKAGGRNFDSLGVCVVGEFYTKPPSDAIYRATIYVLRTLCMAFYIDASEVYGHREFESGKTCPGSQWDLEELREDLKILVPPIDSRKGVKIGDAP